MRFVPIKSEAQQAMLLIHRARDLLVRQRTSLINALRAHLAEFGVVVPKGAQHGRRLVTMLLTGETFGMPDSAVPVLLGLARRCQALEAETAELEREMRRRSTEDEGVQRLLKVPGVGPITATALAATIPDANAFRSAREFAAWLGLVPRQSSSGGRERLGGITKMGAMPICADCWFSAPRRCSGKPPADRTTRRHGSAGSCARSHARSRRWPWPTRRHGSSGLSWPEAKRTGSPHEPSRPAVSAKGKGSCGRDGATVDNGIAKPATVKALTKRGNLIGTRSADFIRASGHEHRANKPDT